jgi:DNA-binding NarL/FixJ family response regulator
MRSALRMCLSPEPDIEVVGEAGDGQEAVALAVRLRPDVVIMDVRMPVLDGVAATGLLTAGGRDGPSRVLIITAFDLDEYVLDAFAGRRERVPGQGRHGRRTRALRPGGSRW